MYLFKEGLDVKIKQIEASRVIGITQANLSLILNRKMACRKVVAFCITKYIDKYAEIDEYFERVR